MIPCTLFCLSGRWRLSIPLTLFGEAEDGNPAILGHSLADWEMEELITAGIHCGYNLSGLQSHCVWTLVAKGH